MSDRTRQLLILLCIALCIPLGLHLSFFQSYLLEYSYDPLLITFVLAGLALIAVAVFFLILLLSKQPAAHRRSISAGAYSAFDPMIRKELLKQSYTDHGVIKNMDTVNLSLFTKNDFEGIDRLLVYCFLLIRPVSEWNGSSCLEEVKTRLKALYKDYKLYDFILLSCLCVDSPNEAFENRVNAYPARSENVTDMPFGISFDDRTAYAPPCRRGAEGKTDRAARRQFLRLTSAGVSETSLENSDALPAETEKEDT